MTMKNILFFGCALAILGFSLSGKKPEIIDIANISDRSVGITYSIPEYTKALILLRHNGNSLADEFFEKIRRIASQDGSSDNNAMLWESLSKNAMTVEQFVQNGTDVLKDELYIIAIINNSAESLHLNFAIPSCTEGLIWLKSAKVHVEAIVLSSQLIKRPADLGSRVSRIVIGFAKEIPEDVYSKFVAFFNTLLHGRKRRGAVAVSCQRLDAQRIMYKTNIDPFVFMDLLNQANEHFSA